MRKRGNLDCPGNDIYILKLPPPPQLLKELAVLVPGLGYALLGSVNNDAPGYFDVEYLKDELLIIYQQGIWQAPRGVFALVKTDSCDP